MAAVITDFPQSTGEVLLSRNPECVGCLYHLGHVVQNHWASVLVLVCGVWWHLSVQEQKGGWGECPQWLGLATSCR